jgi:predicted porin
VTADRTCPPRLPTSPIATVCGCLLLTTLAAMPAAAEVSLYGQFHAGVASIDGSDESLRALSDERDGSFLGAAAQREIVDGLTGVGRLELGFDLTDWDRDDDPVFIRQGWAGVQTAFGTILAGRMESAYQRAGGPNWDELTGTFLEQRRNGGMSGGQYGHNSFRSRHLEYRTPMLGGFQAIGQFSLDERSEDEGDYNVGLVYFDGAWEVAGGYAWNDAARSGENRNLKLGIRYDAGEAGIGYQYEDVRIRDEDGTVYPFAVADTDDGVDLLTEVIDTDIRHHMLTLHQRYTAGVLWLAGAYMNARDDDFSLQSYTIAWIREFDAGLRWYVGYQYQDRNRGYPDSRLNILATGLQLRF